MATYRDGAARRATDNTVTALTRSARNRQCPRCGRKAALRREVDTDQHLSITACRWEDCGYERVRDYSALLNTTAPRGH